MSTINSNLTDIEFKRVGHGRDRASKILACITFGGIPHHLEAIAVSETDAGQQRATDIENKEFFSELCETFYGDSTFMTVTIRGREYALFLFPYCR
jgi:hypothetical protein